MYLTLDTICDKMLLRLNLSGGPAPACQEKNGRGGRNRTDE